MSGRNADWGAPARERDAKRSKREEPARARGRSRLSTDGSRDLLGVVFLRRQILVAHRLRVLDNPTRGFRVVGPPKMKDDAVRLRRSLRDFLSLLGRAVQNLHPSGGDFHRVVVIELVPSLQGDVRSGNV